MGGNKSTKKGSTSFNSAPNTCRTFGGHSNVAVAFLSHYNYEHSCWLLLSQAGMSAECNHFCAKF